MIDDVKLKAMLKIQVEHISPSPELWERVANRTRGRSGRRRWVVIRSGLGVGLRIAAACIVLGGLVFLSLLRDADRAPVPGGTALPSGEPFAPTQSPDWLPTVGDVSKTYFSGYPGADRDGLGEPDLMQALGWLAEAEVIGPDPDTFRPEGGDFHLVIELRTGGQIRVRAARDCVVTKHDNGTRTTCTRAAGQVTLYPVRGIPLRLRAQEMEGWLRLAAHPAPPPDPISPLAALRRRVSFPIFIPDEVPAGWVPQPPTPPTESSPGVIIEYRTREGILGVLVLSGPAGCCLDGDPRKTGETIKVRGGITAHFLNERPEFGGPILWWQEAGAYVALSGPQLTKADLVRIAESISPTADLVPTDSGRP